MISVYAYKFNPAEGSGFTNGDVETLLFTIPNQNGNPRPFLSAVVKEELGNAGSFEFSVDVKSRFYHLWKHMRTLLRVEYDDTTVFYGRVLTIDRDMFRTKKIHCEGAYTFFMDSVYEGTKEGITITLAEYLQKLIDAHNDCMSNTPEKMIYLGEVPGKYSSSIEEIQKIKNDTQKFANSKGYKQVKEWLDELAQDYGGYMRVRYSKTDRKLYLDWLKVYFNKAVNNQTMSVSSNVVDLSDTVEVDNIFTHVIPTGKNGKYIGGPGGSSGGGGGGGGGGGSGDDEHGGKHKIIVSVSPQGSGTVGVSPSNEANKGAVITLTPTPKSDMWFASYASTPGDLNIKENSFVMPGKDVYIVAYFGTTGQKKVVVNAQTGGWITVSPAIAYPGDTVNVITGVEEGYKFTGYTSSGVTLSNDRYTSFTMPDKNVFITANFEDIGTAHNITISKTGDGNGVVSLSTSSAKNGDSVTVSVYTPDGNKLDSITSDDVELSTMSSGSYGFTMPNSDVTISLSFSKGHSITVTKSGTAQAYASVKASASKSTAFEGEAIFLAKEYPYNVQFDGFSSSDVAISDNTFVMPDSDVTVTATFTAL